MQTVEINAGATEARNLVSPFLNEDKGVQDRETWASLESHIDEVVSCVRPFDADEDFAIRAALTMPIAMDAARAASDSIDMDSEVQVMDVYPIGLVSLCFRLFCGYGPKLEDYRDLHGLGDLSIHDMACFAKELAEHDIDAEIVFDVLSKAFNAYGLTDELNPFARFTASRRTWDAFFTEQANKLNADAEPATSIAS